MRVAAAVAGWLALSLFTGFFLSALGAGSLAWPWLAVATGAMALFFSPLLLALRTDDDPRVQDCTPDFPADRRIMRLDRT